MVDRSNFEIVTVGEREFEFSMLNAVDAAMMLIKMRGIASNAFRGAGSLQVDDLQKAFNGMGDKGKENDFSQFIEIIAGVIDSIGEDVFKYVSAKMLSKTKIKDPQTGNWRNVIEMNDFTGQTMDYFMVVFYALRYQYADFFGGLSSIFAKLNP